jgi:hypothetical protein
VSTHHVLERPEATTRSIDDLLRDVRLGKIRIPQFQRNFQWSQKDILSLFDSVYRGYPIGNLLFWETNQHQGSTTEFGPISFAPSTGDAILIVDGQQRLVAFAGVLLRDRADDRQKSKKFRIYFDLKDRTFKAPKAREQIQPYWLPLSEVADTLRYLQWLRELPQGSDYESLVETANYVARALRDYRIPVYIVKEAGESDLRDIFERLNSGGKPLSTDQIFDAIHGQQGAEATGDLGALRQELSPLGFGDIDKSVLLKGVGALLDLEISTDLAQKLRTRDADDVQRALTNTRLAMEGVIGFIKRDAEIPHVKLLPYKFPLVPLVKFFHLIPEPSSESRRILSQWLWRGACSGKHRSAQSQDIRSTLKLISKNETATIEGLFSQVDEITDFDFDFWGRYSIRSARTRLACIGLISFAPKNLNTGEDIDATAFLDEVGSGAFSNIFPPEAVKDPQLTSSVANRLFHPQNRNTTLFNFLKLGHQWDQPIYESFLGFYDSQMPDGHGDNILESHGISRETLHHLTLVQGCDQFLSMRGRTLERHIMYFLRERCGF